MKKLSIYFVCGVVSVLLLANANIAELKDGMATIKTDVGRIVVEVAYALSVIQNSNKTLVKLEGDVATIKTEIGEVKGRIISVQDGLATIETDVGQLIVSLPNVIRSTNPSNAFMAQTAIMFGTIIILALVLLPFAKRQD